MPKSNEDVMVLPKNIEAERAIFSIILLEPERFIEVIDKLKVNDFYSIASQEIWRVMNTLYKKGVGIDIVDIRIELQKQEIDPSAALKEIAQCYEYPVLGRNLENLVTEVKNKSLLRQIVGVTTKHNSNSKLEDAHALNILTDIEKDVLALSEQIRDERPVDTGGILNEVRMDIVRGEESGWRGFSTKFKKLDERTGGLIPTHVWIIGAYTGIGKTFFALQLILNILEQGAKVILFSTEMDRKMNMLRLLGNLADLGTIYILKGRLKKEEYERRLVAEKKLTNYKNNLLIYDNVYTVEEIRLKAKKRKVQAGLDVIVVDFIQNLKGPDNIYERMSKASIELQQIAQELNITVVLVSQVSQAAAGWASKEAIEYKGAGEIAAVADVGLWLSKEKDEPQYNGGKRAERDVHLRKVRHGAPGWFKIRIEFPSGRVTELGEEQDEGDVISQLENE